MFELITTVLAVIGFSGGIEDINENKVHFGLYTNTREYGYVYNTESGEFYLDTVYIKESTE